MSQLSKAEKRNRARKFYQRDTSGRFKKKPPLDPAALKRLGAKVVNIVPGRFNPIEVVQPNIQIIVDEL